MQDELAPAAPQVVCRYLSALPVQEGHGAARPIAPDNRSGLPATAWNRSADRIREAITGNDFRCPALDLDRGVVEVDETLGRWQEPPRARAGAYKGNKTSPWLPGHPSNDHGGNVRIGAHIPDLT